MSARRTCCRCLERFDRSWGFDTFQAGGGAVWICWPCYRKGLRSEPVKPSSEDPRPGVSIGFSSRAFLVFWIGSSVLIHQMIDQVASGWPDKGGWNLFLVLWLGGMVAALLSIRRRY